MHGIEEHYYKIIRIFLKTLGIWPYQQSYLTLVQRVLFTSILSTFIIVQHFFQLLAFFTMRFSTGLLLRILSLVFPTLLVIIKYCTFVIQADKVKQLIGQVGDDLNLLQDKSEIDIIKKYADSINFITIYGIVYTGVMTLCSTGLTIMTYILHACALLKIASHRMKHAIQEDVLAMSNPVKEYLLYQKIVDIVFIHRRVMQFISFSVSSFVVSFALLLIFGVISLSLNLFRLLQLMTVTYDIGEISVIFLLVTLHINYMFAVNYGGEILQNHGMELFEATYNGLWYAAPLRTQKLLLFIMQKTTVKVTLICGGIFVASLEGFVTLVNAAVSYFTVIYSTR
ncbi:uncharacterized protein LOC105285734 isoform X3 [Ooceraea biroi]|uniref:uncharacterized protein LOC105285734 isoform X3 n=1 Tax=Ooceraea biroi TaxID=2015173 RepID=UPI000F07B56C|nr:uncharacterized protein LOC105285734 isoform X3 [Ooceraea biroi]